jgi:hypothetical protein
MAITKTEINEVLEKLMRNPRQTVTLPGGRSYTNMDIDKLLRLKTSLVDEIDQAAGINRGPFYKCSIDNS